MQFQWKLIAISFITEKGIFSNFKNPCKSKRQSKWKEIVISKGEIHKKAYELIWLRFFWFSTDVFEIFSKCWIYVLLKPHKISIHLDDFFSIVSKGGGTKGKKTQKPKKVQPNELISLFVYFPFKIKVEGNSNFSFGKKK